MFGQETRPPSLMQPDRSSARTSFAQAEWAPESKMTVAEKQRMAVAEARNEREGAFSNIYVLPGTESNVHLRIRIVAERFPS